MFRKSDPYSFFLTVISEAKWTLQHQSLKWHAIARTIRKHATKPELLILADDFDRLANETNEYQKGLNVSQSNAVQLALKVPEQLLEFVMRAELLSDMVRQSTRGD